MIKLTPAAIKQIRTASAESNAEGLALRLAAREMPEGGLDYGIGFDERREDDIHIEYAGVEVIIAPSYVPYFEDATLDYVELSPGQFNFIFLNPNDANYTPPKEE